MELPLQPVYCKNSLYRPQSWEIMYLVASVRLSVRPSVRPSVRLVWRQIALIRLPVAHKEHTSVWVICRLSPYVCLSVCLFVCALTAELFDPRPSAKSNKSHYQFKVFVCVSVISGRMWIITRMRSIGVLILHDSIMTFVSVIPTMVHQNLDSVTN